MGPGKESPGQEKTRGSSSKPYGPEVIRNDPHQGSRPDPGIFFFLSYLVKGSGSVLSTFWVFSGGCIICRTVSAE